MVYLSVSMASVYTFTLCTALAVDPFQIRYGVLPGYPFRVQGVVEEILEDRKLSNTASVKITHVFVGPDDLVGRTFNATGYDEAAEGWLPPGDCMPKLQPGEVGLWGVYQKDARLDDGNAVRKSVSPREYQRQLEIAQAEEKVADVTSETTQVELLEGYARKGSPPVSAWAITTLGSAAAKHPKVRDFLRALADEERLSIAAQVALDKALVEAVGAVWAGSGRRLQVLEKWVSAKLPPEDAHLVLVRLQIIPQQPEREALSRENLLRLVKIAALNEGLPAPSRVIVPHILGWIAENYGNRQPVFDATLEILRRAKVPEVEIGAAAALRGPLKEEAQKHRHQVLAVLPSVKNQMAAKLLKEALADEPQQDASDDQ